MHKIKSLQEEMQYDYFKELCDIFNVDFLIILTDEWNRYIGFQATVQILEIEL